MKKDGLLYFALKFSIIALVLLAIFYFVFPYYRLALRYSIGVFYKVTSLQPSSKIFIVVMPYVSLSALILATPKRTTREKIKFMLFIFALFYIIDFLFIIIQILSEGTTIQYYHILVAQDFFTIALPIVIWFLLYSKDLGINFESEK